MSDGVILRYPDKDELEEDEKLEDNVRREQMITVYSYNSGFYY